MTHKENVFLGFECIKCNFFRPTSDFILNLFLDYFLFVLHFSLY